MASLAEVLRPRPHWDRRILTAGLLALLFSLAVAAGFEAFNFDLAISDRFYDRIADRWLVDFNADRWLNRLFYRWPKILVAGVTIACLVLLFAPVTWRRGISRTAFACVLSFWLFALSISALKNRTDVYFPRQLARYQAQARLPPAGQWRAAENPNLRIPYRRLWEAYEPPRPIDVQRGRGFPAAHATTGFWLMGLAALASSRAWQLFWLVAGTMVGFVLGTYQVLNGGHFMSHTIVSWGIACAFLALVWCLWGIRPNSAADKVDRRG